MIVQNFTIFMNEAKKEENFIELVISKRFEGIMMDLVMKSSSIAKQIMLSVRGKEKFDVSFIDVTDKDDMISYITSNKAKQILDKALSIKREQDGINNCWISNRQDQNLSRFIFRLYGDKFNQKEIQDFVGDYKIALKGDKTFDNFTIVEGNDIHRYYHYGNYSREGQGQLQRSCMRQDEKSSYFGIYEDNSDKMKMLILKNYETGKIYGRANLWYLDDPSGKIFMDRIYTTFDWQIKLFIDYAIKNNYIYKSKQIYGGNVIPVIIDGKKEKLIMTVNLKPISYDYYPYVDTLQFYCPETGVLTSDVRKFKDEKFYSLVTSNGEPYQDNGERFGIDYLGRIVHNGNLAWSNMDNVNIHVHDAIRLEYRDDYVTPEHDFVRMNGYIYLKNDCNFDPKTGEYELKKDFNY